MAQTPPPMPPGWYPDSSGTTRWWDGTNWTEHTQAPAAPSAPTPTPTPTRPSAWGVGAPAGFPPAYQPKRSRRPWIIGAVVAAVVVVAAVLGVIGSKADDHGATAAEKVVRNFLEADDLKAVSDDYVSGFLTDTLPKACTQAQYSKMSEGDDYTIPRSEKTGAGATVHVEVKSDDLQIDFHLVDLDGWKIDDMHCTG